MLLAVMFCYLFFYTGRQNLGFAAKGMQEELLYSASTIALLNSVLLLGYGIGKAINGNLADICGTTAAFYVIGGVCIVGALVILPVRE